MLGLGKSCWSGVRPSRRRHQPGREREGERWRGWAVGGTRTPLGGRRSQSVSAALLGSSVEKTHTGNMINRKLHVGNTINVKFLQLFSALPSENPTLEM